MEKNKIFVTDSESSKHLVEQLEAKVGLFVNVDYLKLNVCLMLECFYWSTVSSTLK